MCCTLCACCTAGKATCVAQSVHVARSVRQLVLCFLVLLSVQNTHLRGSFSTHSSPSGRIRGVQNTTRCRHFCTMKLNSTRIRTVRGHAPYKYPPRNTMRKSPTTNSNPLRISWSGTSFSPTASCLHPQHIA